MTVDKYYVTLTYKGGMGHAKVFSDPVDAVNNFEPGPGRTLHTISARFLQPRQDEQPGKLLMDELNRQLEAKEYVARA